MPLGVVALCLATAVPSVMPNAGAQPLKTALTATHADPTQPDISGLWVITGAMQFAPDRAVPKLQGEYQALYEKRAQAFKAGIAVDDATAECLPAGLPHLLIVPYPFEIVQTPGRVLLLYEYDSAVRRVPLGVTPPAHPEEDTASYNGDSYGHWDGDTLVIETSNIRAETQLDFTGVPHSDVLRVTERLHRKDATTLEDQITLTDPKAYAEPFSVTRVYRLRPKWKISEYVCEENNRNKPDEQGHTRSGVPKAKSE
jgi:hypothetical protein